MEDFEFDNEYDMEDFDQPDTKPKKQASPKKAGNKIYKKQHDTSDDNLFDDENLGFEDVHDVPVKNVKPN